jgi:hydrogenase maturation protein HypF
MVQRTSIEVEGIVQGVGFRPFVYRLAHAYGLSGWVCNTSSGVVIEVEGPSESVDAFLTALRTDTPPLAIITEMTSKSITPKGEPGFSIDLSADTGERAALIAPDVSVCDDCLRELFDPADRRYLYPFINCTNCGPRYTIIEDIPYDRAKTTMAKFAMCPECRHEYDDPLDRRFHAQPDACWSCGPRMTFTDAGGVEIETEDPIVAAAEHLAEGKIVAIKSLGGFQLVVDATQQEAVTELRRRKRREEKPLAVMAADIETVEQLCMVSEEERDQLLSPARPIVLLGVRADSPVARAVAPHRHDLGVMLPYTPMHYLLFRAKPFVALVMTSGNLSEEPISIDNDEGVERFGSVAEFFLMHDRPIHLRSDDSVLRVNRYGSGMIRRSRGYAPRPVFVEFDMQRILACGAELKNTVCLTKGRRAFVSQHVGDIQNVETYEFHLETVTHLRRILDIEPEVIAHDLHPDYLCTPSGGGIPIAEEDRDSNLRLVGVQHHHAHIASVMAENGIGGPVLGIALDGTGYGTDGHTWGGEFLLAEYAGFERLGHFEYASVPGGDAAARQGWRSAAGYLALAFGVEEGLAVAREIMDDVSPAQLDGVFAMIGRSINSPLSSGCGRLFDAMAAIAGVRSVSHYEGQGPCEFEAVMGCDVEPAYDYAIRDSEDGFIISFAPMVANVVEDVRQKVDKGVISRRVHETLVSVCVDAAERVRELTGVDRVALSGGVFQNVFLAREAPERLTARSFSVYTNRDLPPNDGGICLGQAAVAAHIVADETTQ